MGWFGKKEEEMKKMHSLSELPKLPSLPRIDNFDEPHQLPNLPSSSFGERFSKDAIKDAVSGYSGEREDDEEDEADESEEEDDEEELRMMREPPRKPLVREETKRRMEPKRAEPVFVRIDKFEESMNVFEKAEKNIGEIEALLRDIRKVKDEEERELESWEEKIQSVKKQIEKIDSEIFSKIE